MAQALNKSGRALVLDLINAANNITFTEDDFTWAQPVAVTGRADGRNTALEMTVVPTETLVGSQTVFYNRLDLSQLFNGIDLVFEDVPELVTTGNVVALINAQFELALDETDVVFEPLVKEGEPPFVNVLKAQPGSYAYIGEVTFKVGTTEEAPSTGFITTGFFFVNTVDGKIGASIESLTDVEDENLPLIPTTDLSLGFQSFSIVSGGYNNEIFAISDVVVDVDNEMHGLQIHVSKDGGLTWSTLPTVDLVMPGNGHDAVGGGAVMFKGVLYFVAITMEAWNYGGYAGVYRTVVDSDNPEGYVLERVLDGDFVNLVTDDETLFALGLEYNHVTQNGVDWTQEPGPDIYYDGLGCVHQGELVGFAYNSSSSAMLAYRRAQDGTYTTFDFTLFPDRTDAYINAGTMFSVDTKIVAVLSMEGDAYWAGDIIQSIDGGASWTLQNPLTGMSLMAPPADDGQTVIAIGTVDVNAESGDARMIVSTDRAESWNTYNESSFAFLVDSSSPAAVVTRRVHNGDPPMTTPALPAAVELIQPLPNQVNITPPNICILSDDRILLNGTSSGGGSGPAEVNGVALPAVGFALLTPEGDLIDTSDLGLDAVMWAAVGPDGSIYVAEGYRDSVLRRINSDLTIDASFSPSVERISNHNYAAISRVFVQSDGKIVIVGDMSEINGVARYGVGRLHPDGTLDTSFTSPFTSASAVDHNYGGVNPYGGSRLVTVLPSGRFFTYEPLSPSTVFLTDADGVRIPGRSISNVAVSAAFEYENGDLLLALRSTSAELDNKSMIKWLTDGTVVTDIPTADIFTEFFLDLGSERLLINGAYVEGIERSFAIIEADGSLTTDVSPIRLDRYANDGVSVVARQSGGAVVAALPNQCFVYQSPYPLRNQKLADHIFRFYLTADQVPF